MSRSVLQKFVNDSLMKYEEQEPWSPRFRGSSLPICPRKLMLGKFHDGLTRPSAFTTKYHMAIGSAIHRLIQEMWGKQGSLWGDWRCECGAIFSNQSISACKVCGGKIEYVEKTLVDPASGFSGHCDAILDMPQLGGYVVGEIKSRNYNIIKSHENKEPYESDRFQVSAYATLISRQFGIPVVGRMILWVGKPRPAPYGLWWYSGLGEDIYDSQVATYADMERAVRDGDALAVPGTCDDIKDADDCPFAGVCFSPRRDALIMELYMDFLRKS